MTSSNEIVAALADPVRLRIHCLLVLAGEDGVAAAELEGRVKGAARQVPRLLRAGLITRTGTGALVAVPDAFRRAAEEDRGRRAPQEAAAGEGPGRAVAQLFSGGRLVVMPVRRALRRALLEHLAERFFEPGRRYTETEVNTALGQCYDDYSTLRRYLIDERLLARSPEGSAYWRSVAA